MTCLKRPWFRLLLLSFFSLLACVQADVRLEGITLSDPALQVELIDSHPDDFFLSHDMDLRGRLFLGSREAVFLYERNPAGGFLPRKELVRFPKNTWVYDIEVFGDDLLLLTNTALYRLPGAAGKGSGFQPEKILWGNPLGHHHQGLHGMEFAPDGALLISLGDPHPGVHLVKTRPDHFWHWTWYVGPENKPVRYTGVGGVMRLELDTLELSVFASGLRNPCGISFDRDWHLFANDNDQEGSTANPCRLVQVPPNSWSGWARGWESTQNPKRLDMLPTTNWELDVPVGQGYYDHYAFGDAYRGSLFVANWGSRSVNRYPLHADGAGFKATAEAFLHADGLRRPVSVMPTNDGSLIVSLCYMNGNEGSPRRQTDLVRVSPRKGFDAPIFDISRTPLVEILSAPIQLRAKAHREILRRGGAELESAAMAFHKSLPDDSAFSSLIFLAAAHGAAASVERICSLAKGSGRTAALAWRAAAAYPERFAALDDEVIIRAATQTDDPVALCGLLEFLHAAKRPIPHAVSKLGAHDDPFVRQSAVLFLARQAPDALLARLATGGDEVRLAATLATAFRIWEAAEKVTELPEGSSIALEKHLVLNHPDGRIDLRELKVPVGTFMLSDWWKSPDVRAEQAGNVGRLRTALRDKDSRVALAAAVGLFFLDDAPSNDAITPILARNKVVLSIGVSKASKKDQAKALAALEKATLSTSTDIPAAFRDIDWDKDTKTGDPGKGKVLFTERGCIACHLAPDDGMGGAIGPTLVGVGERFAPSYLAASMLVPNLTVSPNFHPNTITMKDGTVHTGYVEQGGNPAMLKLRVITGQIVELNKQEIVKQDASEQSMMPAGLIQTPDELRDMIAFLQVGAMKKGAAQANEDAAAKRKQQRKRKRLQPNTKSGARLAPTSVHPSSAGKPNIVLILADDFGWGDASCNHPDSPIPTPAIDRIAEEGIRFTNAHTPSSVCTPTRYGVLTGRYPWRTYLKEAVLPYYAPALITADQTTLASYLRSQGYRSGGFGKWHLGLDWTPVEGDPADWRSHWDTREAKVAAQVAKGIDHSAPFRNGPTDVGFDTYFGTPSNCTRLPFFIKDDRVRGDPKPDASGIPRDPACARDKVDDLYVDRAITFMKSHRKAHADRPFFVYLPLNAIHGATAVPERFGGKSGIGQREDKILWANQSVDRILAALTELNLDDNTLVIFTTDNGPIQSRAGADKGHHATGPYRGLKTSVWDGGSRVPFIARWPGKIPPGTSSDQLIGLTDLLATFAAICGAPLPAGAGTDSFNQLPALLQQTDAIIARSPLVTASYKGLLTLRDDRWKAVFGTKWAGGFPSARYGGIPPKGTPKNDPSIGQLYDLSADPGEQNDLWDSHPEVIEGLRQKLEAIKVLEEHEAPVEATPLEEDFVPIFNGTDLGDWDGRDGAWVVKEGAIVCTGAEKTRNWIVWRKAQPANFMLRLDFKWDNGNSGVQVRSDDLGDHQIFGYQVEIATQSKMGLWHHSLLGKEDPAHAARFFMATAGEEVVIDAEGRKTARRVAPAEDIVAHYEDHQWNRLEIIADGNTLIQKINGVEFSKVTDADARMSRKKGFIALQDHGKGCQVAFRNLRIKRLP